MVFCFLQHLPKQPLHVQHPQQQQQWSGENDLTSLWRTNDSFFMS
jgi:hypothetical protein